MIILAVNIRIIPGILEGIFQAAKDKDSALIIELAKTECNLEGGYTGLTPQKLPILPTKPLKKSVMIFGYFMLIILQSKKFSRREF